MHGESDYKINKLNKYDVIDNIGIIHFTWVGRGSRKVSLKGALQILQSREGCLLRKQWNCCNLGKELN